MRTTIKKTVSILLSLAMLLSVFGGLHVLPAARAAGNGKALQLTDSGEAANIPGAQTSAVYFGNYKQSGSKETGFNVDPVKWRVLSNADGKLFLLSDQNLDVVRYNESMTHVTWETCTLRKWLNGYAGHPYDDTFIGSAFSGKETAAIAETAVVNDDNPGHGTPGGSDTTDKVFLLSIAEATDTAYGFTDNYNKTDARVSRNTAYVASGGRTGGYMYAVGGADLWWLRSPGFDDYSSSVVGSVGNLYDDGNTVSYVNVAVRPAFNLNLNSVLFTSSAENGKAGDGALAKIADYGGSEWKLTLLDDTRAFAVTETQTTAAAGGTAALTYTGATVGTNEYISAILADGTGSAVYYGRLTQPDAADGTLTFTVPADLAPGTYTLKVFSEQYNGDYKTDYASAFSDVTLTVISELDAAKAAAKEELAKYKNADDYRAAEQADLAAAISDGKDAIDGAVDINAVTAALADAKAVIDAIKTDAQLTAEEAAAALAAAKTSAKEELAAYKNADDYRDAQKTELAAAITAGNAAIDAAADIDAVAAALADAKAVIDAIKTDAQLTAEEAAAALAAAKTSAKEELAAYKNADDYRDAQKTELAAAITAGNAAIDAAADIDAVANALADAKAAIDAIKTDAQLTAEELAANKAAFEAYKESVKTLADGMKKDGDSDACIALIEAAKEAVDAQTYDEDKTPDENKDAVDGAAALTQLAADLADQRAAEADDPREAFEAYRETLLTLAQALRKEGDSAAVTALIDEAVAALTDYVYDGAKTLAENEDALAEVLALFAGSVKSQRQAERQEALNHEPCSLCGEHHTGSLLENFIGVIHGIIWIMRSFALIAA